MNIKYIILAVIAVTISVVFGRNPIEESRERREKARAAKGDPLITSIEEHNKKRRGGARTGSVSRSSGGSDMMSGQFRPRMPSPNRYQNNNTYQQNPSQNGGQLPAQQQPAPATNGNDSYYPPLPTGQPHSSKSGIKGYDPRNIRVEGPEMYVVDSSGARTPVEDGIYPMSDGKGYLIIQNGRRVLASN